MAKIQNLNNASVGKDMAKWYLLYIAGETVNSLNALESCWTVPAEARHMHTL